MAGILFESYYGASSLGESYLMHHGVKGQKWGRRRYQYEDGSLTPEGRSRLGFGLIKNRFKNKSREERSVRKQEILDKKLSKEKTKLKNSKKRRELAELKLASKKEKEAIALANKERRNITKEKAVKVSKKAAKKTVASGKEIAKGLLRRGALLGVGVAGVAVMSTNNSPTIQKGAATVSLLAISAIPANTVYTAYKTVKAGVKS